MPTTGVYIISGFENPHRATRVRIGCAWKRTVWERVHSYDPKMPNVKILAVFAGGAPRKEILEVERKLKERFAHLKMGATDWYRLEPELKQFIDQHREGMGHRRIWPLPERKKPKVTDIIRCYVGGKEVGYFERREVRPKRQGDTPPWWLLLLGPPGWLLLLEWLFSAR